MNRISASTSSICDAASYIPPDAIYAVTKRYLEDPSTQKVNVGQGTYRDEHGQPWTLPSVRLAEKLVENSGHEYLPIRGLDNLCDKAIELVFHDTSAFEEERIASCQSLSGTGALYLAGLAIRKTQPLINTVYITDPTWSNHELLFTSLGFEVGKLPYYKNGKLDIEGYLAALKSAVRGAIIVLHTCAHNPTGCDPSRKQWEEIAAVIVDRNLFPIFDSAYLGFNSGCIDEDAWAIKYFVDTLGLEACVALSFAKNMGLYGERAGVVEFVLKSKEGARVMNSVLENVQRATISTPPAYGARIASAVLSVPEIRKQWLQDLKTMSGRIRSMREKLYRELVRLQTPGDWSHIINQSGMFGYTGISPKQIEYLETEYHVYMANTSRISIAGLNDANIEHFARAIDDAVRHVW